MIKSRGMLSCVRPMKHRSPVLGYNHNVRYAGRVWHVQTEDSGVQNPHIFTHLFNEGTIIASTKTNYDAASEVVIVQRLMQGQHKTMMRDLKTGAFDAKIERYFGPIVREPDTDEQLAMPKDDPPAPQPDAVPPHVAPLGARERTTTIPELQAFAPPPAPPPPLARTSSPAIQTARPRQAILTPARPAVSVNARSHPTASSPPPTFGAARAQQRAAPPTIGSNRSGVTPAMRPAAEGGVVSRPSVIVGGGGGGNKDPGKKRGESVEYWKSNERRDPATFGENIISERSLDEVILAYLSEDAPKK